MQMKEVELGPELATKYLEHNVHNRTVRQSVVERYARDMKAGKWLLTHEPIAFAKDGTMVDGEHRCWAVVESGATIRVMVARDVDMETQAVIDTGLPRTMVDVMHLVYGKSEINSMHVAIAKVLSADSPGNSGGSRGPLTHQELVRVLADHDEAISFAVSAFPRKVRFVTVAPVLTVVARAYYHAQKTLLVRFAELLLTGKGHRREEESAILLRNWLLEKAPFHGAISVSHRAIVYSKTERALASFLIGEELNTLYAAHGELFPLPSEQQEAKAVKAAKAKAASDYTTRIKTKLRKKNEVRTNGSGARA